MSTEIAIREPDSIAVHERDIVDGWIAVVRDVGNLADYVAQTDFVPKALRGKPAAIAACILTGREMGIGPMTALKVIHMVQGSPSLSAEFKRARALELGHEIVYEESTTTRCVVRGRRRGEDTWTTVTWHIDDAKRAKLTGKDVWQQHPRRMLQARATSELCDLKFPDCSWGLGTTEVLEDSGLVIDGTVVDAADAQPVADAKPATAQRASRRRQQVEKPDPTPAPQPATESPSSESAAGDLPPLPGEDEPEIDKDAPGSVTKPQLTKLGAIFTEYGFKAAERQQRLTVASQIVGRELETSSDLSLNEARALIDTLESCGSRDKLIALMNGVEDASDEPGDDD